MARPLGFALLLASLLAPIMRCVAQANWGPETQSGSIVGTVRTGRNQPVENATVELRGAARIPFSTFTSSDGSFELNNIPEGEYALVAKSRLEETSQEVHIRVGQNWLNLTMPSRDVSTTDGQATVSAAQLKVPEKARNLLQKARDALSKSKLVDAARYVEKALSVFPRYAEALTLRGVLELQDNQHEQARADAEQAIEYDPNYGKAYIVLGSAYVCLQQIDQAIRTLDRGIAITPDSWQGYYEMSRALMAKGDFSAGLRQAEKASALTPRNFPALHVLKADAYIGLKNHVAAGTELEAYLKEEPEGQYSLQVKRTLDQIHLASSTESANTSQ
jgi:tetratricopeptide (TPR) repeat protein